MKRTGTLKRTGAIKRSGPIKSKPPKNGPYSASSDFQPQRAAKIDQAPKPKRKPKAPARKRPKATPAERKHMRAVKSLPCRACGRSGPSDAHHCYHDRNTRYGGMKAPHTETIPLCKACHQDGPEAIHKIKRTWRKMHGPDHSHVPAVKIAIYGADLSPKQIDAHWGANA